MRYFLLIITILASSVTAMSQAMYRWSASQPSNSAEVLESTDIIPVASTPVSVSDSLIALYPEPDTLMSMSPLPRAFFLPAVFDSYDVPDSTPVDIFAPDYSGNPAMRWVEDARAVDRRSRAMLQRMYVNSPGAIPYFLSMLPEAPKEYYAVVDPIDHSIEIKEVVPQKIDVPTIEAPEIQKRHWIKTFNASLQFSQAYVSPNWYQGGNNNLNMLANIYYNVKLNPEYHKNLLFETTAQYKLGINNAPDDSIHAYNISDDLFQINTTFGVKAAHRWYYSLTAQFKTQLLNSYNTNSHDLRSAFLSPGELTAGIGMTYNYANPKKTFTFDASVSPLSYNMRICTNNRLNPETFGIEKGKKTVHNFGSSAECKLFWQLTYNISFRSRLFTFTDYDRLYADWENTLVFEINRFLTTQIFAHLRYDTDTPPVEDPSWHKLQIKEILSIGFAYKFSSI